jgi:hypothetical protein
MKFISKNVFAKYSDNSQQWCCLRDVSARTKTEPSVGKVYIGIGQGGINWCDIMFLTGGFSMLKHMKTGCTDHVFMF